MQTVSPSSRDAAGSAGMALLVEETHARLQVVQNMLSDRVTTQRARWIGPHADSFYSAYRHFDREFEDIKQALEELHAALIITGHQQRLPRPSNPVRECLA